MHIDDIPDPDFRLAVEAIDAGDVERLARILDEAPGLLSDRLAAGDGYFREPYLLWFVAGNPVRSETLPSNAASMAAVIIEAARRRGVESLPRQADSALGLVASGRVARESGVQLDLIDVLCDAGADPDGALVAALAHREVGAAERLLDRGASLSLIAAVCLKRRADIARLLEGADAESRQRALSGAALYGDAEAISTILASGVDVNAYSPDDFHPHATALHHAVDSGSYPAVRTLVEAGAATDVKDRVFDGTPLDWARHLGRPEIEFYLRAIVEPAPAPTLAGTAVVRGLVPMIHVADLGRSIAFYEALGFQKENTFAPDGAAEPVWAWLQRGAAQLMLTKAGEPVDARRQAVLFYLYFDDVEAAKAALAAAGIDSGPITRPFYSPKGEFQLVDPDGYCLMISHT